MSLYRVGGLFERDDGTLERDEEVLKCGDEARLFGFVPEGDPETGTSTGSAFADTHRKPGW